MDAPVYYGDTNSILNQGVGTYVDSSGAGIPGESKTILMAGHNNTFFNDLQSVEMCIRDSFLDRIWALSEKQVEGEGYRPKLEALINRTIKKVGEDIDALKANTAIAQLMILAVSYTHLRHTRMKPPARATLSVPS